MVRFLTHIALLSVPLLFLSTFSQAQEQCGLVEYEKLRHTRNSKLPTEQQFEQWMQQKINEQKLKTFQGERTQSNTYTIPVVVHVIHNGEPIGTGLNIPDAQIFSQIQVLNDDYKRLNADKTNTPAEFQSVAGSIDMQFVLAKQDPEGLATNGITRTLGTKTSWAVSESSEFKSLSYWPAENYLNIWVVNLSGSTIGFAQLPVIDPSLLAGLADSSTDRLTDGVIVDYQVFGSNFTIYGSSFNLLSAYNKGRTATHEIGHIFGLRHVWGDSTCGTDYVDDTPFQTAQTSGCPSSALASCDTDPNKPHKMFQNYLDYTNDACMNLFTQKQINRMVIILANSPRRNSLLTSPGLNDPAPVANDLGIRRIVNPQNSLCTNSATPQVEVRNYGSNQITSTQIQLAVNGTVVETKTFSSLALDTLHKVILSFSNLSFTPASTQQVAFQIIQTNGGTDVKAGNNSSFVQVIVPANATLPIIEPFNSLPTGWTIVNPDGDITWVNTLAPDNNPTNRAMYVNFYDDQNIGTLDWLVTPAFVLSNPLTSQLKFDWAYAQFPGQTGEGLKVYALPGCTTDLSQGILLFDLSDDHLATASSTSNVFVPSSNSQWQKSFVKSLSSLTASTSWQLAFVARNANGNNLYVDNVVINDQVVNDVVLTSIVSPALVHCQPNPAIQFSLKNFSTSALTSFQVTRSLNGGSAVTQNFTSSVDISDEKTFTLSPLTLNNGVNQITLTVSNPNGFPDASPSNNTITFNTYLDQSADRSPLRQTFDNPAEVPWVIASPVNEKVWETVSTNKNQSVVYKAFSNTTPGEESWFVSPVLDLSLYTGQSLFFDVSYAQKIPLNDRLKILGSYDCGLTYPIVLYDRAGSEFSTTTSTSSWTPATDNDWRREYVNIDTLAGKKNIRLALIATNANGNNLYLDNLEIFAGDDPSPPVTTLPYQLYYPTRNSLSDMALTFNLPEKKDVQLQIFSIMGQVIADNVLPDTLNQTYYFDLSGQAAGIYLFRLQIDSQVSTTKVFIGH